MGKNHFDSILDHQKWHPQHEKSTVSIYLHGHSSLNFNDENDQYQIKIENLMILFQVFVEADCLMELKEIVSAKMK